MQRFGTNKLEGEKMDLQNIQEQLNTEFSKEDIRIIFWFDDKGEYEDEVSELQLDNAKLHILDGANWFYSKWLLNESDSDDDVIEFYYKHTRRYFMIKGKMLAACIKHNDIERSIKIIELLKATQMYENYNELNGFENGWERQFGLTIEHCFQEFNKRRWFAWQQDETTPDMIEQCKEIAHMCFEYLSEESIDRIKAEIRRMCPNEDGTDEYIQKLLDDVKIYCTFPKPRGKGGAPNINRMSDEIRKSFEILSNMERIDVICQIMEQFAAVKDILKPVGKHISLTNTSIAFEKELLSELVWREWIPLEKGTCVKAKEVKLFPSWMSEKERKVFLDGIPSFKENYISHLLYEQSDEHFLLLKKLGAEEISDGKLRNIITDGKVVSGLSVELIAKIFVYEGRSCFTDEKWVGEVCLPTESGFVSVRDCYTDSSVNGEYCKVLQQLLSDDEWSTLITQFPVFEQIKKYRVKRSSGGTQLKRNSSKKAQLAINKWKTPIQNCMAAETMNGFSVKDVSKKCDEYSLICANANGDTRYVLVIPVAHIGDTIKLSESQYSAAQRIGESYELFVIATEASEAEYIYIKNPYEKVELNRVVKEWEWVCDKYDKEKQIQPVTEVEVVDDYILKNILPDYFNRQQRNFLQDIIMSEDDINYDDKYKISIEQINSISDFYTSRKMIDVINGKIMISMDKKAALKKILGI